MLTSTKQRVQDDTQNEKMWHQLSLFAAVCDSLKTKSLYTYDQLEIFER